MRVERIGASGVARLTSAPAHSSQQSFHGRHIVQFRVRDVEINRGEWERLAGLVAS